LALLEAIRDHLTVGTIYQVKDSASLVVSNKEELDKIIIYFDKTLSMELMPFLSLNGDT